MNTPGAETIRSLLADENQVHYPAMVVYILMTVGTIIAVISLTPCVKQITTDKVHRDKYRVRHHESFLKGVISLLFFIASMDFTLATIEQWTIPQDKIAIATIVVAAVNATLLFCRGVGPQSDPLVIILLIGTLLIFMVTATSSMERVPRVILVVVVMLAASICLTMGAMSLNGNMQVSLTLVLVALWVISRYLVMTIWGIGNGTAPWLTYRARDWHGPVSVAITFSAVTCGCVVNLINTKKKAGPRTQEEATLIGVDD